jgi:hypothetical protein
LSVSFGQHEATGSGLNGAKISPRRSRPPALQVRMFGVFVEGGGPPPP